MDAGVEMTLDEVMKVVEYNRFNVTFSGGDPMYQAEAILPLARATGFHYEDIRDKSPYRELLEFVDVLVDGPYMERLKPEGPALRFRGSSNQRFISLPDGVELAY